ncbi:putative BOI-related E3 ubiquitin-protein ligase 2 [Hibiscus syriacus]|uniref:RING-type E3 ubiquitin transferase n=1 Tax=Hibiscus syriacus TaxID=106335 RepID=A0A6A3ATA2_HIBSY|nr:probable BOI-related E3 ubiquitin-protein ligase 2 [Hibiscus syriacus]KAE8706129.1 putative BOI-related E3 ubiquitin-protein ligase 2 [Hibiscus syriacus]
MAVEARHLTLFPSPFLGNGDMMNHVEANGNLYPAEMEYGFPTEGLLPLYNSFVNDQKSAAAAAMKSESSLTCNNVLPLPRKRPRDSIIPILSFPSLAQQQPHGGNNNKACSPFSFLGHDISLHMEQQQLDIDHLISQHTEKMRVEIEEKRKRQARNIMEAIEGGVMKKLRAKEEEIEKIGKLNWALEERVKSLCIENQIWRDLAQTNEATANALRTNLEQVLAAAQLKGERTHGGAEEDVAVEPAGDDVDDAQSFCGSSSEVEKQRTLAATTEEGSTGGSGAGRVCRNCGKEESCVLLLPCRHLCLCTSCGSTVHTCPACKSTKNASVHVNMS